MIPFCDITKATNIFEFFFPFFKQVTIWTNSSIRLVANVTNMFNWYNYVIHFDIIGIFRTGETYWTNWNQPLHLRLRRFWRASSIEYSWKFHTVKSSWKNNQNASSQHFAFVSLSRSVWTCDRFSFFWFNLWYNECEFCYSLLFSISFSQKPLVKLRNLIYTLEKKKVNRSVYIAHYCF